MDTINWGIVGLGSIANDFAQGLQVVPGARLAAVGSRSQEKAEAFGSRFDVPARYGSYADLAADPSVDIVYVATPHPMHAEDCLLCLSAGKAVLCEKPFTINAALAEQVIAFAREKRLFLMEGMWTRFFPAMARLRALLQEGAIGEPRLLQADFGFRADFDPESRLLNPALGGGALLDVGIYVLSLASMVFGAPTSVEGLAAMGKTGVDEQMAATLSYAGGQLALLSAAVRTNTPQEAVISGTEGGLRVPRHFWCPTRLTLERYGNEEEITFPKEGNGFNYEIAAVMDCLRAGRPESDVMPLEESLAIARTMDALRRKWGLQYPMEASLPGA